MDLAWYLRLVADVRSVGDALAVPKIVAMNMREAAARFILDKTKLGDAIRVELSTRWHSARAEALGSSCYCVYHACDVKDCPPGFHDDD